MADKDGRSIGFVGLGLMGSAFTRRLVERGYSVVGFDAIADKVAAAGGHGVLAASSAADVTRRAEIVLMCVTSTHAVEEAVFGPEGIAAGGSAGKIVVDHSTSEMAATRELSAKLKAACGMSWVDAPVSGGPGAAAAGTLAIMAGGEDSAIARIAPVMSDLSAAFTHLGPVGAGQATKMVNQVLVLNTYCVLAEALRLAERCGVDASKIPQALAPGHAGSNMLKSVFPQMIARDFAPRGFARQVLKDLDMLHDVSKEMKAPLPMSAQANTLFRLLVARGHGELDATAVLKLYLDEPV